MDDDYGFGADFDEIEFGGDVDGESGASGCAAVICHLADTMRVGFRFTVTVEEAVQLAARRPCPLPGCCGEHDLAIRDGDRVRIIATAHTDAEALRDRLSAASRESYARRRERYREIYWETQRRFGLAPPPPEEGQP
ncbi:MAG: hypothetical protein K2X56_12835 [Mycobacterium pseudokansasii]|uniref:hypothetical protein n=1 Tax=Mycobacterium pseudokansasii TaxID=2341080 RepID=UPI0023F0A062|nr:hypothetical protein [Mycobacterium pseudokansasii]MBY0388957.1 hypothetical protein [Mycobacterium pseudokansasii]